MSSFVFCLCRLWTLITSFILYSDWGGVVCQRSAVPLWPQLWSPTPHISLNWTWVITDPPVTQECLLCVVFCRVQTVGCRLSGQFTVSDLCHVSYFQTEQTTRWAELLWTFIEMFSAPLNLLNNYNCDICVCGPSGTPYKTTQKSRLRATRVKNERSEAGS